MAKGIYKRWNVFWIRYAGADGKKICESSHSDKFNDAEHLLLQRKTAVKEGRLQEIARIENHTFRELAERYVPLDAR